MKIIHIPSGYDPSANEYQPEQFRLRGCLTPILLLVCAGLIGYILINNNAKSAAAIPTKTYTPTSTQTSSPVPTGEASSTFTATPSTTPTNTLSPSRTFSLPTFATMTPTSVTLTKTWTPSPTHKPTSRPAARSGSSSSGAADSPGGCGPCSGSVSGGSQTIWQTPSGPGQTVSEQSIYTPSATWIALSPAPTEIK